MTEPFEIGEALYDPTRQAQAVVSLLDLMRIGIYRADGTPIRQGDERDDSDLQLTEAEVRGLISEGVADLTSDPDGELPYSFADLHAGLAPFMPGTSADELARVFDVAYAEHADELVPQVMLGQPIEPATPLTRVHLWLLLADGFIEPAAPVTASLTVAPPLATATARWGTAGTAQRLIVAPPAGMGPTELTLLIGRLQTAEYLVGLLAVAAPHTTHEGHGRIGQPIALVGTLLDFRHVESGPLSTLPRRVSERPTIDITIDSTDPGTWHDHGTFDLGFGRTQTTSDNVVDRFTPKREDADGRGEEVHAIAWFHARAPKAQVIASLFDVPFDAGQLSRLVPGDMRSAPAAALLTWHAKDGILLTIENEYTIDLGLREIVALGDASATGLDVASGFLARRDDGIYRGTMRASGYVDAKCDFLGHTITERLEARQLLDVYAEVRSAGRREPTLDVVHGGSAGAQDLHVTFYPAGPPELSDGECIKPVVSPGGGPLGFRNLTYKWFNDSRWTDPNLGYTIMLPDDGPDEELLEYRDIRLSARALGGPGGISGVDSTWDIDVKWVRP